MIAEETDWAEHRGLQTTGGRRAQIVAHVRLEPRVARTAAAALEYEFPFGAAYGRRNESRGRAQLFFIRILGGHRLRNAVRREDESRAIAHGDRQARVRAANVVGVRRDEAGVSV